jgi:hypothetical protein
VLLMALGLVAALLGAPALPARAAESERAPLSVSIDTLTPSTIPHKGRVTVTGEITNDSGSTWTDLQVYMFISPTPITSADALTQAAGTDPATEVGGRLTAPGLYDEVADLAPGESSPYVLSVRRKDLGISGQPGVYWFGVHVLGATHGVREAGADGRARTFLPLMGRHAPSTRLALVVPVKQPVRRDAAGRVLDVAAWERSLRPDGRLDRVVGLTAEATMQPVTWLIDPAMLDAVRSLSQDNPPLDLSPTDQTTGSSPGESASPSASSTSSANDEPSGEPSSEPSAGPSSGTGDQADGGRSPVARDAATWLQELRTQAGDRTVLALPYGDLDVAAVTGNRMNRLYRQARDLSTQTMTAMGITASPVVAPANGYLPARALRLVGPDTPVLLDDLAYPGATQPVVDTADGGHVVLTDTAAGSGGPSPTPGFAALAVRQRILSAMALHALSPSRDEPVVVSTPSDWNPGPSWGSAQFFGGLDVPWLQLVDLPTVLAGHVPPATPAQTQSPAYPHSQAVKEVPHANLLATEELGHTGDVLANLLTRNDRVDDVVAEQAMLSSSMAARRHPDRFLRLARAAADHLRGLMAKVRIEGPPFVMMSSEEGPIQVSLVNGLDQPVTVGVRAETRSPDLQFSTPDPVTLGPGKRASVRLRATSTDIGVHSVKLVATNSDGDPLGSTARFNVRTSQVGMVIWVIMGAGAAILFLTIAFRVARRLRRRKATHGPLLGDRP